MDETEIHQLADNGIWAMDSWYAEQDKVAEMTLEETVHLNDTIIALLTEENDALKAGRK